MTRRTGVHVLFSASIHYIYERIALQLCLHQDMASMTPEQIAAALDAEWSDDDDKKKKKKQKKGKQQKQQTQQQQTTDADTAVDGEKPADGGDVANTAGDADVGDEEDAEGSGMKTAAQKKKEKKERQKQKKSEVSCGSINDKPCVIGHRARHACVFRSKNYSCNVFLAQF